MERAIRETCDERFEFRWKIDKEKGFTVTYASSTIAYLGYKEIDCMVKVIKKNLPLMPPKTREFFGQLIRPYDK